jgi:hypothetical protein
MFKSQIKNTENISLSLNYLLKLWAISKHVINLILLRIAIQKLKTTQYEFLLL